MKKILLLTTDQPGEAVAARNLREAVLQLSPRGARCEIVDLFAQASDTGSRWALFSLARPHAFREGSGQQARLRDTLRDLLRETEPDAVVSTSPVYNLMIEEIYRDGRVRDFALLSLVVDSVVENDWARSPADRFLVVHEEVADTLHAGGIAREKLVVCGYPVSVTPSAFREKLPSPAAKSRRILYLVNGARKKAMRVIDRLLEHEDWHVTVRVDEGEEKLEQRVRDQVASAPDRLMVVEAGAPLPPLLAAHDIVISRAATDVVHEAIAARCPIVVFRLDSAREKNNFSFLRHANASVLADRPREIIEWIERAFQDDARLLALWQRNLQTLSRSSATPELARLILDAAGTASAPAPLRALPSPARQHPRVVRSAKKLLLCDLHSHTTWSDGKLTIPEIVDFYGQREFDCLCITDHLCDPNRLLGRLVNLTGLVIPPDQINEYFAEIEREKKRAWEQYELLLMAGVEFNKDGYTAKTSAHLLGVDLQRPIDPTLDIKRLIVEIQAQGGLAIASHPHEIKSEWGKNTLYFWENLEEYAPLIDVWEVANRDDIFNPVGLKKLPFMANSDFHKPKHIHSWKTVLHCEKDPEAIKHCLRVNRDVSLTLYRDHRFGLEERMLELPALEKEPQLVPLAQRG